MKKLFIFIGIVCILYGISILNLNSGTSFWLIWEAIGGFCFLLVFLIYKGFYQGKLKYIFNTLIVSGLALLLFLCGCMMSEFNSKGVKDLDYIIVLGAQVRNDGPSPVLKYRLDQAITYLNDNPDTLCYVSGGQGANEPFSEAKGMYDYLVRNGIDDNRICLEDQSTNTVENIYNCSLFIDKNASIGIVTNNFHTYRAVKIAKKQGLKNVYGIASPSHTFYLPNNMLRECFGIIKDFIYQNI